MIEDTNENTEISFGNKWGVLRLERTFKGPKSVPVTTVSGDSAIKCKVTVDLISECSDVIVGYRVQDEKSKILDRDLREPLFLTGRTCHRVLVNSSEVLDGISHFRLIPFRGDSKASTRLDHCRKPWASTNLKTFQRYRDGTRDWTRILLPTGHDRCKRLKTIFNEIMRLEFRSKTPVFAEAMKEPKKRFVHRCVAWCGNDCKQNRKLKKKITRQLLHVDSNTKKKTVFVFHRRFRLLAKYNRHTGTRSEQVSPRRRPPVAHARSRCCRFGWIALSPGCNVNVDNPTGAAPNRFAKRARTFHFVTADNGFREESINICALIADVY